jgi:hypothetical protein
MHLASFKSEVGSKSRKSMKNFVFTVAALLIAGFAYAGEKSQTPAKAQTPEVVKTEKKAATAACECQTVEVARKATWAERRAYSRNLVVVEPVKVVEVKKVESKSCSTCESCDTGVLTTTRRAARRVRGVFDGLLCR